MKILAIDTSCDDTCVSIIKIQNPKSKIQNFEIVSNEISSQVKLHAKYGGVYPFLAKREHIKNLPHVFKQATKDIRLSEIDFIAVTVGPGLEPCLWQGINFAKDLSKKLNKPLIAVNHIEAHILANFIGEKPENQETRKIETIFPAICLVVSGGHTQLILMRGIGKYKLIGETRDDAAGECFDKAARILGLGYPGGPAIAKIAAQRIKGSRTSIILPRPMIHQKNYDFSFSGLKTAVLYKIRSTKSEDLKKKEFISSMCKEVQQAIIDVLIKKTIKAIKDYRAKSIILGGGVAANEELRKQFKEKIKKEIPDTRYLIPDTKYCTDNAAMIGVVAFFHQKDIKKDIEAKANLRI